MLDAASPDQPGWDCTGGAGQGVLISSFIGGWVPGAGAMNWPENTGILLPEGEILVAQMHYNLANTRGTDTSTIRVSTADSVERVGHADLHDPFLATAFGDPATLEPGQAMVTYTWEDTLATAVKGIGDYNQVEIHSILPHMHGRGRTMAVELEIGGQTSCGLDVDRWDFNWQFNYFYDQPIVASPTDTVRVTCGYNTQGDTEPVYPGFGTDAEMCLIGLYIVGLD
jgi:hypothetical protein